MPSAELLKEELATIAANAMKETLTDEDAAYLFPGKDEKPDMQKGLELYGLLKTYGAVYLADSVAGGTKKQDVAAVRRDIALLFCLHIANPNEDWISEHGSVSAIAEYFAKKLTDAMGPKLDRLQRVYLGGTRK